MILPIAIALLGLGRAVTAQSNAQNPILGEAPADCHNACTALQQTLQETYYGTIPADFKSSFFSTQQSEVIPACIIRPVSAEEVSSALQIIREYQCHFAVKSGGHARSKGSSNAEGGITIDLVNFKTVEVSEDQSTTSVGAGNRWVDVYRAIEDKGVMVVGGRSSSVGVGGFLLGDNVRNFEIVLSNGTITNANLETNPDLYWALRGGGNKFGVVTRFDLYTYPHGKVWGGNNYHLLSDISTLRNELGMVRSWDWSVFSLTQYAGKIGLKIACSLGYCTSSTDLLKTMTRVFIEEENDPYSQAYISFAYVPSMDMVLSFTCLFNTRGVVDPPVFKAVQKLGSVYSTNRELKLAEMTDELEGLCSGGTRMVWADITIKPNDVLMAKILDIFLVETETTKKVPGIITSIVLQSFTNGVTTAMSKNGGNPLGLSSSDGDLIHYSMQMGWDNSEDDEIVHRAGHALIDKVADIAREMGLLHRYIYANYANVTQDVYAGYGEENRLRLREIQQRYDPDGMMIELQPGQYKL